MDTKIVNKASYTTKPIRESTYECLVDFNQHCPYGMGYGFKRNFFCLHPNPRRIGAVSA